MARRSDTMRNFALDAARAKLQLVLHGMEAWYAARGQMLPDVVHLTVAKFAIYAGDVQGEPNGVHGPVPPDLAGRISTYMVMLAADPRGVPGWRLMVNREAAKARLTLTRAAPVAAVPEISVEAA